MAEEDSASGRPEAKRCRSAPPSLPAPLVEALERFHELIPASHLLRWHDNMRQGLARLASHGVITCGSACAGTDIWKKCWDLLLQHWQTEFQVDSRCSCEFVAEIDSSKQAFLRHQFDCHTLIADVAEMNTNRMFNLVSRKSEHLSWVSVLGGGFSCKDLSRMNSQRKKHQGACRRKEGSTGETLDHLLSYISRSRPKLALLECVLDMSSTYADDEGQLTSDSDYVVERVEALNMVCVVVEFNASDYGSRADRARWWALIFDAPTKLKAAITQNFNEVFVNLKLPAFPIERFLIQPSDLERRCSSLPYGTSQRPSTRHVAEPEWKQIHEQLFLENGLTWPPVEAPIDVLRQHFSRPRECEVIYFANKLFPEEELDVARFFDANHSVERTLRCGSQKSKQADALNYANPWRTHVPTMTTHSSMVMRSMSASRGVCFKRIHPLEMMSLTGWALDMYRPGTDSAPGPWYGDETQTPELLADLAGNAWSGFAVLPILISAIGAVPWHDVDSGAAPRGCEQTVVNLDAEDDFDDSSSSATITG